MKSFLHVEFYQEAVERTQTSLVLEQGKKEGTSSVYSFTASPCPSKMPSTNLPHNRSNQTRQCQPRHCLESGHEYLYHAETYCIINRDITDFFVLFLD